MADFDFVPAPRAAVDRGTRGLADFMAPVRGDPPSIEWCAVHALAVDPSYQRTIDGKDSQAAIRRIAMNWDWRLCGVLTVARRGTERFVIDGQHRLEAARLRGDITHLPCVLSNFDNVAEEADCFVAVNAHRRALTPVALHRARVAAGEADAVDLDRALAAAGLALTPAADWRVWPADTVPNVRQFLAFRKRHGAALFDRALGIFAEAWRGQVRRQPGTLFAGIGSLLTVPVLSWGGVNDALLTELLAAQGQLEWHAEMRAEMLGTGASAAVAAHKVFASAYSEAVCDD